MQLTNYTITELLLLVDNKPDATPLERELAARLQEALDKQAYQDRND